MRTTAAGTAAALGVSAVQADDKPTGTRPDETALIVRSRVPGMEYRRLGRTNYLCSRIVQGFGRDENLWRRLLARGVNYWDTGWGYDNGNHEKALKPFLAEHRDKLWITSKATGIAGYDRVDPRVRELYLAAMKDYLGAEKFDELNTSENKQPPDLLRFHKAAVEKQKAAGGKPDLRPAGKHMARMYLDRLDESLQRMGIDHVDSYFLHGVEIPWVWDCHEVWEAYEQARKAGKVKHFGFSVHKHHKEVLASGVEANASGPWKIGFGCVTLLAALLVLRCTGLDRLWTTDQTAIARRGQPIVQAVYEFRRQHGAWPVSLDDLVPQYLPSRPPGPWDFSNGFLSTPTGLPRTGVCYDFSRPDEGWQSKGDFGEGRLNVPPPLATRPSDLPVFDRVQQ